MPYQALALKPGIEADFTPRLNAAGFSQSNLIRWRRGMPEKLGGWQHLTASALTGTPRKVHAWADLAGNPYAAFGSEQRLQLFYAGALDDVTPTRKTSNIAPDFSTTNGSPTVTVTDTAHGAVVGDWVFITCYVAVGGLILLGFYKVQTVVDANNYTITAAANATATVNNGGAVPSYATTNAQTTVTVTLANHGFVNGATYINQIATTVATITFAANSTYTVSSVTTNTFVITAGSTANATTTGSENGGNAQIVYLVASGHASASVASGFGIGGFGSGPFGQGGSTTPVRPRLWFLDNWGQNLVGNYTGSTLYQWIPPWSYYPASAAAAITGTDVPQTVNGSFVISPAQILFAWGCDPVGGGTQDPNLVRWSDVSDNTDWLATSTNQAGSYRIPSGSRVVGMQHGIAATYLWTDVDLWLVQYQSLPFVFGFNQVASGAGLAAPNASGVYKSSVFWMSQEQFMVFDGNAVEILPCTCWDYVFKNLDTQQIDKVWCWVDSLFGEIWWFFPSTAGTGEIDKYVKYSTIDKVWDYGPLVRTCGCDQNVYGQPLAVDGNQLIQQHDVPGVYDADGSPMDSWIQTGDFAISDGDIFTFMERFVADLNISGGTQTVYFTFYFQGYPNQPTTTIGPIAFNQGTAGQPLYGLVRGRGRVCSVKIESRDLGVFWRLGKSGYVGAPAGRR